MPLTQQQFEALVGRLEQNATRNPKRYRLTLGAFATLGYLYIFAILFALIGVAAALIVAIVSSKAYALVKILIPIVVFIGIVARTLWVKIVPPTGLPLERGEYPELFSAIDEVRRVTRAPVVHVLLLTNELNAAVVQVPRLGVFGWQ